VLDMRGHSFCARRCASAPTIRYLLHPSKARSDDRRRDNAAHGLGQSPDEVSRLVRRRRAPLLASPTGRLNAKGGEESVRALPSSPACSPSASNGRYVSNRSETWSGTQR
jgi:hypothetical protein